MISALAWVPKGAAREVPERFRMSDEDYATIRATVDARLGAASADAADAGAAITSSTSIGSSLRKPRKTATVDPESAKNEVSDNGLDGTSVIVHDANADADFVKEFDMDNYSSDDDEGMEAQDDVGGGSALFSSLKGLTVHASNSDDPYVTLDDKVNEDEDMEELMVGPEDNLLLTAKTEDNVSHIEVHLYEGGEDNLFVHHDIMLPSFPLCLEWFNFPVKSFFGKPEAAADAPTTGNFVAVGTFEPEIEVWNLDVVDSVFPDAILGAEAGQPRQPAVALGKGKKKRKLKEPNDAHHVDAVLCLAWNRAHPSLLASGSADTTVKLWDLSRPDRALRSFRPHRQKVQALAWNTAQPEVLASGAYDKRACVFDTRTPDAIGSFKLSADVEVIKWDPFHPERLFVSTEDGIVRCFDARKPASDPLFTIHAHDAAVSAMDLSPNVAGLLVTGAADKKCKVWSIGEAAGSTTSSSDESPSLRCLLTRDLGLGKVFSATFAPDPGSCLLAVGGSRGSLTVWNLEGNPTVRAFIRDSGLSAAASGEAATEPQEFTVVDAGPDEDDEDDDGGMDDGDDDAMDAE